MPISAVAGILMGDYRDRVQVATGQYNNDIEARLLRSSGSADKLQL
ncbi:MAG: hypothetical protein QY326_01445 [Bdellovibrionota bacterium]|nr:MAG: hypothetical protein QY326_01445 [Bdellovibrionota bacterium]